MDRLGLDGTASIIILGGTTNIGKSCVGTPESVREALISRTSARRPRALSQEATVINLMKGVESVE